MPTTAKLVILALLCPSLYAQFSTVTCTHGETGTCRQATTCSQANVQATINASAASTTGGYVNAVSFTGDGVYVPPGSCSWSTPVSWTDKNINVIGNGGTLPPNSTVGNLTSANTIISHSGDAFQPKNTNTGPHGAAWHIAGFTMTGSTSGDLVNINVSNPNQGGNTIPTPGTAWAGFFRVDHITYSYSSAGNVYIIYGPVWGLFDHLNGSTSSNHFEQADFLNGEANAVAASNFSQFFGEYAGRLLSAAPGSSSPGGLGSQYMDFIEDSIFSCTGNYSGAISDSESGGQRMAFRHNTLSGTCFHYAHWTRDNEWDGDLYEIYNNSYNGGVNGAYPMRMESGTGVIFNNTFVNYPNANLNVDDRRAAGAETAPNVGPCNGGSAVDGNAGDASAAGWPCAGQIGNACLLGNCARGSGSGDLNSLPLIAWNNGTQAGCSTGGSCTNSFLITLFSVPGSTQTMANYIKPTAHSVAGPLNGAVDYCQGTTTMPPTCGIYTNSYAPYTYPNPLQGGGGGSTGVTITANITLSANTGAQ